MGALLLLVVSLFVLATVLMVVTFLVARQIDNYSIVDAVWAFGFFLGALLLAWQGEGWIQRKILMVMVVMIWSLRLSGFLAKRIARHHPNEDNRYLVLRRDYGDEVEKGFFRFFQYQAWSIVLLMVPFAVMVMNRSVGFTLAELAGGLIMVLSALGESVADRQKAEFKEKPENKGMNCEVGLWTRSRHPNYFFESCYWIGVFIMVFSSPGGAFCFYVPLLMLHLLMNVTGVPMSEENGIKVYGDAYRDYQKRVPKFFPKL